MAAEVGTSTTAIYRLWGSMPELVRALFLEGFRRLGAHLAEVHETEDPLADLRALGLAYHANAIENPEFYDVMFACPVPGFDPTAEDATYALATLQVLIDFVERGVAAGQLAGPADEVAYELWAVNHGVTSLELRGLLGRPDAAARHLERVLDAAMTGYRTSAPSATSAS